MIAFKKWNIEFVKARKESYKKESRNPIIQNGNLKDDQIRRDFTINCMFICLNKKEWGNFIDPFGGKKDIKKKKIKTTCNPKKIFIDDPLRMMRAIRISTQLKFKISKKVIKTIKKNRKRIKIISKERIMDEMNKIIKSETASNGLKILFKTGLLKIIFPKLFDLQGSDSFLGKSHEDNFYKTLKTLKNISNVNSDLLIKWCGLFSNVGKLITKKTNKNIGFIFNKYEKIGSNITYLILKKIKFPIKNNIKHICKIIKLQLQLTYIMRKNTKKTEIKKIIYKSKNLINELILIHKANITSKNSNEIKRKIKKNNQNRNIKINGNIIMKKLNIKPSKEIKKIKKYIEINILNEKIKNNEKDISEYINKNKKKIMKIYENL